MKTIKVSVSLIALLWAGIAQASVHYTNDTDGEQTITINEHQHYSYYGFDNWDSSNVWSLTLAPGESADYDDSYSTAGDGGDLSDLFDLLSVE